jgi:hypothetical protein
VVFVTIGEAGVLTPRLLQEAAKEFNDWYESQRQQGRVPDPSGRSTVRPLADRIVAENFRRMERRHRWDPAWYYTRNYGGKPSALDLGVLQRVFTGFERRPEFQRESKRTLALGVGPSFCDLLMAVAHTEPGGQIHVIDPSLANRSFLRKALRSQPALITYSDGSMHQVEIDLHQEALKWENVLVELGGERYRGAFRKARLAYRAGDLQVLDGSLFRLPKGVYDQGFMFCVSESVTWEFWIYAIANQSFAESIENDWVATFVTGKGGGYPASPAGPIFPNTPNSTLDVEYTTRAKLVVPGSEELRPGETITVALGRGFPR